MIHNKIKLTKAGWMILLCLGLILVIPNLSQATPLTNSLVRWSGPTVSASFDSGSHYYSYYTDYEFKADEFEGLFDPSTIDKLHHNDYLEAFCVENADAQGTAEYELDSAGYFPQASIVAREYFYGSLTNKTWAQIAIWELALDDTIDLDQGTFRIGSYGDRSEIETILSSFATYSATGSLSLVRSPDGDYQPGVDRQDYLIPVPDAGIMWLLGPAFIMLGVMGRKKSKNGCKISPRTQSLC